MSEWDFGVDTGGLGADGCASQLRVTAGDARGLQRSEENSERMPHHAIDGGVVIDGKPARLAEKFGIDGDGDVSDVSHGTPVDSGRRKDQRSEIKDQGSEIRDQGCSVIGIFAVCASGG